jgi:hypothetical protein
VTVDVSNESSGATISVASSPSLSLLRDTDAERYRRGGNFIGDPGEGACGAGRRANGISA